MFTIHIYTYTHSKVYHPNVHIFIPIQTYLSLYKYIHIPMCILPTQTCTHSNVHIPKYSSLYKCIHIQMCIVPMYTYKHSNMYHLNVHIFIPIKTCAHTNIYSYIHIYIQMCVFVCNRPPKHLYVQNRAYIHTREHIRAHARTHTPA